MLILDLEWHDYIGAFGAALIVIAYFYLQIGKISGQDITFSVLNAINFGTGERYARQIITLSNNDVILRSKSHNLQYIIDNTNLI